jgi:hypothetical protein
VRFGLGFALGAGLLPNDDTLYCAGPGHGVLGLMPFRIIGGIALILLAVVSIYRPSRRRDRH